MKREHFVAQSLADAALAVSWDEDRVVERWAWLLGRRHRWLEPLFKRMFRTVGSSLEQRDRNRLTEWIIRDRGYQNAWLSKRPPRLAHYVLDPPRMSPRRGVLASCALPDLPTPGDLAAWLEVSVSELEWFADVRGMNAPEGRLCHYQYVWVPKSYGLRLMEVPKQRLRDLQRRILRGRPEFCV